MDPITLSGSDAIEALKALTDITNGDNKRPKSKITIPNDVQVLRLEEAFRQLSKTNEFKVGDMVCLKSSLDGPLTIPYPDQPGIVTKKFDPPLVDKDASNGSPDFGREFDVMILVFVNNERCIEFAYDSRLLQRWEDRDAKSTTS